MRCRKCIAEFLAVFVVALLFMLVDFHDMARGAEPETALIVRNEEGRETKLTLGELAKLPQVSVRAKRITRRYGKEPRCMRFYMRLA